MSFYVILARKQPSFCLLKKLLYQVKWKARSLANSEICRLVQERLIAIAAWAAGRLNCYTLEQGESLKLRVHQLLQLELLISFSES